MAGLVLFGLAPARPAAAALVDTSVAWRNPEVKLCFGLAETELSREADLRRDLRRVDIVYERSPYQRVARELLEREFSAERTGIRYTGFKTCRGIGPETPNAPAFLFIDTDYKYFGVSSVGDEGIELDPEDKLGLISGSILNLRKIGDEGKFTIGKAARALADAAEPASRSAIARLAKELDRKLVRDLEEVTILHELGHLAGLQHEEKRGDFAYGQPKWCTNASDEDDQEAHEKTFGTEFDPFAVTNYCADDVARGFAYFHLFCGHPTAARALERRDPRFRFSKFAPYCADLIDRKYQARLSVRDRAALRRLYAGVAVPPGARTYRSNPEEVRVIQAFDALYEALPKDLDLDLDLRFRHY